MSYVRSQRAEIPSCSLTKKDFEKIGKIVENLSKKLRSYPIFSVESKSDKLLFNKLQDFVDADWPINPKKIEMYSKGLDDKSIRISFDFGAWYFSLNNIIEVSGRDNTWIKGTIKNLEDILSTHKNKRHFLYVYLPIRAVIDIFVSFLLMNTFSRYLIFPILQIFGLGEMFSANQISPFDTIIMFSVSLAGAVFFDELVKWLFPYMELKPVKGLRSAIRWILGFLVTLLVGEFLSRVIF